MKTIILHGWGHNRDLWYQFASKIGDSAIAIDMPGFGMEPLVEKDWSVPDYADWVFSKISKYKKVILIGHSFGGRVAAEIASRKPKNIQGLILTGAPCIYRPTLATQIKIRIYKLFKIFVPPKYRRQFYSQDLRAAGNLEKIFRKVIHYDQTKQLQKITVPTLLVWGEDDNQVPLSIAQEINQLIPNSELKIIEDAGHNTFLDNPHLFYGYVSKFITQVQ